MFVLPVGTFERWKWELGISVFRFLFSIFLFLFSVFLLYARLNVGTFI